MKQKKIKAKPKKSVSCKNNNAISSPTGCYRGENKQKNPIQLISMIAKMLLINYINLIDSTIFNLMPN